VTESSGKAVGYISALLVRSSYGQSFHEWAALSITQSQWARAYYEPAVSPGQEHHAAVSCISLQWIPHYLSLLEGAGGVRREVYLAALAQHNSPLLAATKIAL